MQTTASMMKMTDVEDGARVGVGAGAGDYHVAK